MEQNLDRQIAIDLIEKLKDLTYNPSPVERDMITQYLQEALDNGAKPQTKKRTVHHRGNKKRIDEAIIAVEYYTLKKQKEQGLITTAQIIDQLTQKYAISEDTLSKIIYTKTPWFIKKAKVMTNQAFNNRSKPLVQK